MNLAKPLISKIRVAGKLHRVEYESLPLICSKCGRFGHLKEGCVRGSMSHDMENDGGSKQDGNLVVGETTLKKTVAIHDKVKMEEFGEWMVVDRRKRW